jgi:hypothetical protein
MAPRKKAKVAAAGAETAEKGVPAADKIAGVLALIAVKGMDTDDAALKLDAIGFTFKEVSALLDVGPNYVNVARFRKNKPAKKAKKAKKKKVS